MPNELRDAISPYLRSHADNPVAWHAWGAAPFEEAARRGLPMMVSIGYSTCHWCHVMARESFSDPELAVHLNERFVAIKVDREEHPDVDASYLAAAGAFTGNLGWPLTVFVTPEGRAFFAGTYYPPVPVQGTPSFRQVLDAVSEAWTDRRDEVEQNAGEIAAALAAASTTIGAGTGDNAGSDVTAHEIQAIVTRLASFEDDEFGGFGRAPKFPIAPVQRLLVDVATSSSPAAPAARALVGRTLDAMAASPLRDSVEGGFFRYSVRRDWHEPHYERMLYDNAVLLDAYSRVGSFDVAAGIAEFLLTTLQRPGGGFGSAQDSESDLGEGGYYALGGDGRAAATPPKVDEKVLTGWNGLAIGALAEAGVRQGRADWIAAARAAADRILGSSVSTGGVLLRATSERGASDAVATLEDFGMLADGLLRLATATGEVSYATAARDLVEQCLPGAGDARVFVAPGGGDPVLAAQGLQLASDPSEGAYPSGLSAMASAALTLSQLTADARYREAAARAVRSVHDLALDNPTAFGAILSVGVALSDPAVQVVVVSDGSEGSDGSLADSARRVRRPGAVVAVVTEAQAAEWSAAGFELFKGRVLGAGDGVTATAYVCRDFVCRLPVGSVPEFEEQLAAVARI